MIDHIFVFCIYSVLGWVLETVYFAFKAKKLVKRGILQGAYCPLYGASITVCTALISKPLDNLFISFVVYSIVCTTFEFITGVLFDKVLNVKMWDYSDNKYNVLGYICLGFSCIWGLLAIISIEFLNPLVLEIPNTIKTIFSVSLILLMIIDVLNLIKNKSKSVDI